MPSCLCFLRAPFLIRAFIFECLTCLRFYVPYVTSLFLRPLRAFIFLRAYILFMYMLIKLTQIRTYLWLFIFATFEFSYLSTFIKYFTSIKLVWFFHLEQKISIAFHAEKNTWPFERLEHPSGTRNSGNVKEYIHSLIHSFRYLVKSIFSILPGIVSACLGYFWFILLRSCSFQLDAVGYGLFHILMKKMKAHKARQKLETLKKVKAGKARKQIKVRKKGRHVKHVKMEST